MRKNILQVSEEEMQEYAEFFLNIRTYMGYTKTQMGLALGVDPSTIRRWESGKCIPNRDLYELEYTYKQLAREHAKEQRKNKQKKQKQR